MGFHLTIVSPDGLAFQDDVEAVTLPGSEGEFEVLEHHERFLTAVRIGEARIQQVGGGSVLAAVSTGFAEVRGDRVTVLVDACELSNEIDLERAELAKQRAERALQELRQREDQTENLRELQESLSRAVTRIAVAKKPTH